MPTSTPRRRTEPNLFRSAVHLRAHLRDRHRVHQPAPEYPVSTIWFHMLQKTAKCSVPHVASQRRAPLCTPGWHPDFSVARAFGQRPVFVCRASGERRSSPPASVSVRKMSTGTHRRVVVRAVFLTLLAAAPVTQTPLARGVVWHTTHSARCRALSTPHSAKANSWTVD
jgi:hypothetical protein